MLCDCNCGVHLRDLLVGEQKPPGCRFSEGLCLIETKIHMLESKADRLTRQGTNGSPGCVRLTRAVTGMRKRELVYMAARYTCMSCALLRGS